MSLINSRNLTLFRLITFATAILFSVIVMCLSADFISLTSPFYYSFSGFSLATGLITVLTITPIYVIDRLRQGSFFSYIIIEIGSLSVLWIFWLASGSRAAWTDDQIIRVLPKESSCNFGDLFTGSGIHNPLYGATRGCHEIKAIAAFSFLLWISIMGYTITLTVLGIRAHESGQPPWKTSVRDGAILYVSEKPVGSPTQVVAAPRPSIPQYYPPAPQRAPRQAPLPPLPSLPPASRGVVVF